MFEGPYHRSFCYQSMSWLHFFALFCSVVSGDCYISKTVYRLVRERKKGTPRLLGLGSFNVLFSLPLLSTAVEAENNGQ